MDTFLFVEKYRPTTVKDCILTKELQETFLKFVNQRNIPNLLLSGGAGVGKTTVAKAMVEEIGATWYMINGSEESGIDVLRTKLKNFASTVSLEGGKKYVIIDEADYLNPQSTQPALRGMIEEFHKNCGFILTCNFKNRIIEPLHSRCSVIDFIIPTSQKVKLAKSFFQRASKILKEEKIDFDERAVAELINKFFPDWRRVLNELQRYSVSGKIDSGILVNVADVNIKDLMIYMKQKDFKSVRKWVVNNIDNDPTKLFRKIYNNANEILEPTSVPHLVLILADYQYKQAFSVDSEINVLACLTEIMGNCKFR